MNVRPSRIDTLQERCEHAFYFEELILGFAMPGGVKYVQVAREEKEVFQFAGGTHRYVKKLSKFGPPATAAALRDVGRDRTRGATNLRSEPEPFVRWKLG